MKILNQEYIEDIVWLQRQIIRIKASSFHLLPPTLVNDSTDLRYLNAAQLRRWLYTFYAANHQWDKYDKVHMHSQQRRKRRRLNLDPTSLVIRDLILQMNDDDDEC